jgi:sugar/nucleoside kinase (ribokinase family)
MVKDLDVMVVGRNCVDYIAVIDRFPEEDQKMPLIERRMEGGGQGGTSACCVARLGGKVALAGNIGNDEDGRFALQRLKDYQVNIDQVQILDAAPTPVAYLLVNRSNAKRTIIYEPSRLPKFEIQPELARMILRAKTLSLDPQTTYLATAVKQFSAAGVQIVYDCERWLDHVEDMMAVADYFIPSSVFFKSKPEIFGRSSFEENIFMLAKRINGQLIVTHGSDGAYYPFQERLVHVPAPAVAAVDTTGAGDNFHGAFALAVSKGLDLHAAVKLAVAVASLSCRGYGGREALPGWEEALALARQLRQRMVS